MNKAESNHESALFVVGFLLLLIIVQFVLISIILTKPKNVSNLVEQLAVTVWMRWNGIFATFRGRNLGANPQPLLATSAEPGAIIPGTGRN